MPPQKTEPAQVITDGDRLAVLEGLVRHVIEELHIQNEAAAGRDEILRSRLKEADAKLARVVMLADEAAPLLESPAAKWLAQRRALKHKAAPGG